MRNMLIIKFHSLGADIYLRAFFKRCSSQLTLVGSFWWCSFSFTIDNSFATEFRSRKLRDIWALFHTPKRILRNVFPAFCVVPRRLTLRKPRHLITEVSFRDCVPSLHALSSVIGSFGESDFKQSPQARSVMCHGNICEWSEWEIMPFYLSRTWRLYKW